MILGMALGATASDVGPLSPLRTALQQVLPNLASWTPSPLLSLAAGALVLAGLSQLGPGRAGVWDWRTTGLWVGFVAVAAWPASAAAGRSFGLAVVPGTTGMLSGIAGGPFPAWDLWLVLGVLTGGWLAARRSGPVAPSAPKPAALLERFAGGIGLGVGASIATGSTVGQGLTGLALLAPSSFVVMGAIFAGVSLATLAARRLDAAPATSQR